jgi:hypothetical protein
VAQLLDFAKLPRFFKNCFQVEDRYRPDTFVPFEVNSAQHDYLKLCAEIQEQRQLVWVIAIKPRRIGLSRVVTGIGASMAFHFPGLKGRVMAQLGSTLVEVMDSGRHMVRGLPGKKRLGSYGSDDGIIIGSGNAKSTLIGAKALATGEGRGGAALFLQMTEAAHYPPQSPFIAQLPAIPRTPQSFIGIESTPNPDRRGIPFRDMWHQARWIHETRRDTLFVRYFCPWMRDPYAHADPRIAKDAPIDDEEKLLIKAGIPLDKIAWRRQEIKGRYRGKIELFEMENPSDPESAFMTAEMPAFSPDEKAWSMQHVSDKLFRADLVSPNKLAWQVLYKRHEDGLWKIYEEPQKHCEYYIGVDAARGVEWWDTAKKNTADFAAIVVLNGSTCAIAAVLEAKIPPDQVAREVALAGRLYRTPDISEYHYALLNIEITGGYGNEVQRRLFNDYAYPIHRFARWRGRDDKINMRSTQNIGWVSTQNTNEMKLTAFRIALANKAFYVRDARLNEQIQTASMRDDTDAEVTFGHDDVLDATMFAWIARDMNRPRTLVDIHESERQSLPNLIQLSNDPQAVFNRLWQSVNNMRNPIKMSKAEQVVKEINGAGHR